VPTREAAASDRSHQRSRHQLKKRKRNKFDSERRREGETVHSQVGNRPNHLMNNIEIFLSCKLLQRQRHKHTGRQKRETSPSYDNQRPYQRRSRKLMCGFRCKRIRTSSFSLALFLSNHSLRSSQVHEPQTAKSVDPLRRGQDGR
jgi:hypothetical protein